MKTNIENLKKGDWVVVGSTSTFGTVNKIEENEIRLDVFSYDEKEPVSYFVYVIDEDIDKLRKWNVNDTKDGVYVTDGKMIVILKELLPNGRILAYCGLDLKGDLQITMYGGNDFDYWSLDLDKIRPATLDEKMSLDYRLCGEGYEFVNRCIRRFPKYKAGDYIKYNGNVYRIDSVDGTKNNYQYIYNVTCIVNNFKDEPYALSIGSSADDIIKHAYDSRKDIGLLDGNDTSFIDAACKYILENHKELLENKDVEAFVKNFRNHMLMLMLK